MRKDYIAVSPSDAGLDEIAFVQQHWTEVWRGRSFARETSDLADDEVFTLIKPFIDRLEKGARVLDGGCGTGAWPLFLADRGLNVIGLDISEPTIEWLRRGYPHLSWVVGDIRRTELPPGSMDAYISWGTFEHFEGGLRECVDEAFRILRPGGLLCITVPFDNLRHALRASRSLSKIDPEYDPRTGYPRPYRFYQWRLTGSELSRELELGGFHIERVRSFGKIEGIVRMLQHGWGVRPGSLASKVLWRLLLPVVPGWYVDHMLLAVAYRRVAKPL